MRREEAVRKVMKINVVETKKRDGWIQLRTIGIRVAGVNVRGVEDRDKWR